MRTAWLKRTLLSILRILISGANPTRRFFQRGGGGGGAKLFLSAFFCANSSAPTVRFFHLRELMMLGTKSTFVCGVARIIMFKNSKIINEKTNLKLTKTFTLLHIEGDFIIMLAHVYVCICIYMYIYIYICVHLCVCMCVYIYIYVCIDVCMYEVCMYIRMYQYLYVHNNSKIINEKLNKKTFALL
jgi:hypothetical protein